MTGPHRERWSYKSGFEAELFRAAESLVEMRLNDVGLVEDLEMGCIDAV